jgi:hypothetical protein
MEMFAGTMRARSPIQQGYSLGESNVTAAGKSFRMTRRRCEAFFENDENFVLIDLKS